ncbi:MAG TPA: hemolysin family protein [Chloroflexota bacterium]|nr:hemolysin family protein [Chloroflexota bacterium]
MEASGVDIVIRLLVVGGLILLNGFFVAAEFAIVTVRKTRIEQLAAEGDPRARAAAQGTRDPDGFLAACQLGITMASLALGWIGEPALASLVEPVFKFLPGEGAFVTGHAVATVLTFAVITFLHIMLGEQVPKIAAIHNPESLALVVAGPTLLFGTVFHPFIWLVNRTADVLLRFLGLSATDAHKSVHSVEELQALVVQSSRAGVLEPEETAIAQRAFELGDLSAHDVMVPRTEMASVPVTIGLDELLDRIVADGHSRFPVHQGTMDNIVGVVHVKDLLKAIRQGGASGEFNLRRVMREPLFVPETLPASQLLNLMRRRKCHVAIVVDEFGGTAGLVTMEDILERLVGTMQDEFERPEVRIQAQPDGSYIVNGLVNLGELSDALGVDLQSEDYSTIGGYVFGLLGRRPQVGDEVTDDRIHATVEALDGLRIALLRVRPVRRADAAA